MNNFYRKIQAMAVPPKVKRIATTPAAKKTLMGIGIFLVVFSILGFLVAPPILKSILIKKLSENLHRSVAIKQIRVNPFVLSLTIRGFSLKERTGEDTFISFDELYLNLQSISLLKRGFVLSEIKLTKPYVNIVRNEDGSYNFSDLLKTEERKEEQKEKKKPRISLGNIQIINGGIDFHDNLKHAVHKVRDMNVTLPFISTLPTYIDIYVEPSFSATVNGKAVALKGKSKPFKDSYETTFNINIKNLDIP